MKKYILLVFFTLFTLHWSYGWQANRGDINFSNQLTTPIESSVEDTDLPVTLVDFKGQKSEYGVELSWLTIEELDHAYFEVQQSLDGNTWNSLGQVKGQGTTTNPTKYTYQDYQSTIGSSYYRLKIVSLYEEVTYSNVISISNNVVSQLPVIYPNPAKSHINFHGVPLGLISIYNRIGQLVLQNYSYSPWQSIFVEHLPVNTYIVVFSDGTKLLLLKK